MQVNVCVTTFKIVFRELGMTNWPFRQVRSVKRMAQFVQNNPALFKVMNHCSSCYADFFTFLLIPTCTSTQNKAEGLLERLQMLEDYIFDNPSEPIHARLKKMRQFIYKKMHASRRARD